MIKRRGLSEVIAGRERSLFGDKRLDQRGLALIEAMHKKERVVIQQLGKDKAERSGYYRFIMNPKVEEMSLVEGLQAACKEQIKEGHVLAISDTTEINLSKHSGRIKAGELGVISDNKSLGFLLHPTLLLDAEKGEALGVSSVQTWVRPFERAKKGERKYQQQPIEEKESYKWLKSVEDTQSCLDESVRVTYIADREADIYEELIKVKEAKANLLIRASRDRCLSDEGEKLFAFLAKQDVLGSYQFKLEADPRRNREARNAKLEVRLAKVKLKRPATCPKHLGASVELYALEVKEVDFAGENPVLWRWLTTHELDSLTKAQKVIQGYAWRWHIELLFRTLKKKGLDLESSELSDMDAIRKLAVLALEPAFKVMQLFRAREGSEVTVNRLFSEKEQACLHTLLAALEGKTVKQKNSHPPHSLAWAAWIIARLGGWVGYSSQRPPGVITFYQGLARFESIFFGWQLAFLPINS
jgi:Transposase DNA-binding